MGTLNDITEGSKVAMHVVLANSPTKILPDEAD
jgi:hypothetical protein